MDQFGPRCNAFRNLARRRRFRFPSTRRVVPNLRGNGNLNAGKRENGKSFPTLLLAFQGSHAVSQTQNVIRCLFMCQQTVCTRSNSVVIKVIQHFLKFINGTEYINFIHLATIIVSLVYVKLTRSLPWHRRKLGQGRSSSGIDLWSNETCFGPLLL